MPREAARKVEVRSLGERARRDRGARRGRNDAPSCPCRRASSPRRGRVPVAPTRSGRAPRGTRPPLLWLRFRRAGTGRWRTPTTTRHPSRSRTWESGSRRRGSTRRSCHPSRSPAGARIPSQSSPWSRSSDVHQRRLHAHGCRGRSWARRSCSRCRCGGHRGDDAPSVDPEPASAEPDTVIVPNDAAVGGVSEQPAPGPVRATEPKRPARLQRRVRRPHPRRRPRRTARSQTQRQRRADDKPVEPIPLKIRRPRTSRADRTFDGGSGIT